VPDRRRELLFDIDRPRPPPVKPPPPARTVAPSKPDIRKIIMTPLVIIVGADKGGVGKTQITRALRDMMEMPALRKLPRAHMFDGQFPRGDLVQFCPEAEVVNITEVSDQMKIFDTLEGVTIVDIPAGQLGFMLKSCDDARLLDDVKSGQLRMALIHVLGPSVSSLDEIADATAMLGTSAKHFIVKNHINETNFFEWDESSTYARSLRALASVTIDVPHLNTTANEAIQQHKLSFVDFIAGKSRDGKPISRTLRGQTAKWLERTWASFEQRGLARMIEETFQADAG
jgi:hypothetical protein